MRPVFAASGLLVSGASPLNAVSKISTQPADPDLMLRPARWPIGVVSSGELSVINVARLLLALRVVVESEVDAVAGLIPLIKVWPEVLDLDRAQLRDIGLLPAAEKYLVGNVVVALELANAFGPWTDAHGSARAVKDGVREIDVLAQVRAEIA